MTVEIKTTDGMVALGKEAEIIVCIDGKIFKRIIAKIDYQVGLDGKHYPRVIFEE